MNEFLLNIGKQYLIEGIKLETKSSNIEDIYSELHENSDDKKYRDIAEQIEGEIYNYFYEMQIPDEPTMYDYLIISLRHKDCIATFNWDPLLIQAYNRVNKITKDLPQMLFLHGNVAAAICPKCGKYQPRLNVLCYDCKSILRPSRLLYPVAHKDYHKDAFIADQWRMFDRFIKSASLITIWGYSAPSSDIEAKNAMLQAYSEQFRALDEIEVIDIKPQEDIYRTWQGFMGLNNGHLRVSKTLGETLIGEFPRRSVEGYCRRYLDGYWNSSSIKLDCIESFEELKTKFSPLFENESKHDYSIFPD